MKGKLPNLVVDALFRCHRMLSFAVQLYTPSLHLPRSPFSPPDLFFENEFKNPLTLLIACLIDLYFRIRRHSPVFYGYSSTAILGAVHPLVHPCAYQDGPAANILIASTEPSTNLFWALLQY